MISQIDDYKLGTLLGQGCFAHVFESADPATGEPVVIKLIKPEVWGQSATVRENIRQEFSLQSGLEHPGCLKVLAYSTEGTSPDQPDRSYCYAVLEHCAGGELFDEIVR